MKKRLQACLYSPWLCRNKS